MIGLLLGAALAAADGAYGMVFPPAVRAVLTVLSWTALSRGLHADGLADAADGLLSFRSRDRMLEIMREPGSGPMGVAALAGVLSLKIAAVYALPDAERGSALLLAPLAGRCAMAGVLGLFSYVRSQGGLASPFQGGRGPWKAAWALLSLWGGSFLVRKDQGLWVAPVCLAAAWAFAAWVKGKIGGYTGDTLGAACELTEVVMLLALLAS